MPLFERTNERLVTDDGVFVTVGGVDGSSLVNVPCRTIPGLSAGDWVREEPPPAEDNIDFELGLPAPELRLRGLLREIPLPPEVL